jgi:hypothetical protein
MMSGVLIAALILIGVATTTLARADASNVPLRIDMTLFGEAALEWATVGEFSHDLVQPVSSDPDVLNDLGEVALGFWLQDDGANAVSGYVDLSNTLVFTKSYDVDTTTPATTDVTTQDGGAAVNGTFDGTNFTLTSERFSHTTDTGQTVDRQFRLIGTADGDQITGEYRETIWGYSLETVTIVGDFQMKVVNSPTTVPTAVNGLGFSADSTSITAIVVLLGLLGVATMVIRRRQR